MIKLLRSDLYRLFRSKAFYICMIIYAVLISGTAFLMNWSFKVIESNQEAIVGETITIQTTAETLFKDGISYGISSLSDGTIQILLAIVISIFITAEFSYGTMKNIVSKGYQRPKIYLSKLITMVIMTLIMLIVGFLSGTIAVTIITGKLGTFTGTYLWEVMRVVGIETLLHIALASVFAMIAMVIRNNGGSIAGSIIGVSLFGTLIYQLLELIFKNKVKFSQYSLQYNIGLYRLDIAPPMDDIIRSIIVGIAFLVLSTVIGIIAFKNTDIK